MPSQALSSIIQQQKNSSILIIHKHGAITSRTTKRHIGWDNRTPTPNISLQGQQKGILDGTISHQHPISHFKDNKKALGRTISHQHPISHFEDKKAYWVGQSHTNTQYLNSRTQKRNIGRDNLTPTANISLQGQQKKHIGWDNLTSTPNISFQGHEKGILGGTISHQQPIWLWQVTNCKTWNDWFMVDSFEFLNSWEMTKIHKQSRGQQNSRFELGEH